jgi:hypothetical protein
LEAEHKKKPLDASQTERENWDLMKRQLIGNQATKSQRYQQGIAEHPDHSH